MQNLSKRLSVLEAKLLADIDSNTTDETEMVLLRFLTIDELEAITKVGSEKKLKELLSDLIEKYSERIKTTRINYFEKIKLDLLKSYPKYKLRLIATGNQIAIEDFENRYNEILSIYHRSV